MCFYAGKLLQQPEKPSKIAYHHECRELVKTSGSLVRCFDLADERAARPYRKMSYATCIGCCHA